MAFDTTVTLRLVKARLNRVDTALDEYLKSRIDGAVAELARAGIALNPDSTDDVMLCVDYVVWQYQNRDAAGGMPDWLRLRRRERWLQQPSGEETT